MHTKPLPLPSLRSFATEHDNIFAFHIAYLILTILTVTMLNLAFFAMLILAHMALDIVKYREIHGFSWTTTLAASFHESLIDIALFLVALVFSVYFHHSVGLLGISGLLRAELTLVRMIGTAIPKFFILENFLKVIAHLHHYLERVRPDLYTEWRSVDLAYLACIAFSIILLVFAPQITNTDSTVIQWVLLWEVTPWNVLQGGH